MKPKTWPILEMAVEDGVLMGWNRAHKHDPNPDPTRIRDQIISEVLTNICEWFHLEDDHDSCQ